MFHGMGIIPTIVVHLAHGEVHGHSLEVVQIVALQYRAHAVENRIVGCGKLPAMRKSVPASGGFRIEPQSGFIRHRRFFKAALGVEETGKSAVRGIARRLESDRLASPSFGAGNVASQQQGVRAVQARLRGIRIDVGGAFVAIGSPRPFCCTWRKVRPGDRAHRPVSAPAPRLFDRLRSRVGAGFDGHTKQPNSCQAAAESGRNASARNKIWLASANRPLRINAAPSA